MALEKSELGALLVFDVNNIRYLTSTKIGEWERDKLSRWALLTRSGEPILWDFGSAAVHHKLYTPWLKPENCKAGLIGLRGTVNPAFGLMKRHAEEIASLIREAGVADMPIGVDIVEPPMLFELEKAGLKVADGQQVMLEAREIKCADEIALLNRAAAMVDGAYHLIHEQLKPGVRENDIVAKVNQFLYHHGSDDVEAINAISGERCNPHPHNFTDRMVRPGDQAFFDILQSFMGYRTCYYRTFNVGRATPAQHDAYKKAREWLDNAIALIKPGVMTDQVCCVWPKAPEFGFPDEMSRVRPAVRPRPWACAARAADHLARRLDGSPDRDQGGHGVRARDLLPGDRRLLGRAHRGGGGGHRQGLPRDHAVPGGGAADLSEVLRGQRWARHVRYASIISHRCAGRRRANARNARTARIRRPFVRRQSRSRKSAQDDKWSFCLTAGTLWPANQERPCRDDRAGTTHRPSRQRWRLPPSRAIEHWLSLPNSSTSTPIRSHRGRRSSRAPLPMCLVRGVATERRRPPST